MQRQKRESKKLSKTHVNYRQGGLNTQHFERFKLVINPLSKTVQKHAVTMNAVTLNLEQGKERESPHFYSV